MRNNQGKNILFNINIFLLHLASAIVSISLDNIVLIDFIF